ncbi:unnamed protein product [Protopolystoma xenopodis]|uniref:Uncharacterized protein n=1 Tax=Protopolystoma xenopodis TaxID=117903 RepID=A0A448X4A0_9PLAT|nr:unnamed protein product [Protopolystoma xenopodis]
MPSNYDYASSVSRTRSCLRLYDQSAIGHQIASLLPDRRRDRRSRLPTDGESWQRSTMSWHRSNVALSFVGLPFAHLLFTRPCHFTNLTFRKTYHFVTLFRPVHALETLIGCLLAGANVHSVPSEAFGRLTRPRGSDTSPE